MSGPIVNILNAVLFGPQERKVRKYLDEATTDSVLEDLSRALAPKLREVKGLLTTFDAYCVEDFSHQRCKSHCTLYKIDGPMNPLMDEADWNENSLRKQIKNIHSEVTISEAALQLLWRCFHFYAYHPFPRDATDGKVDLNAFQRAVSLLVGQCTNILGTQDGDYFWRHDEAFFLKADFLRILRSACRPEHAKQQSKQWDSHSTSVIDDAMDVLAMTQPYMVSLAPSPDQLAAAAQRFLGQGPLQMQYQLTCRDLSTLLSLLLQLRLREAKWGSCLHVGTFDQADPGGDDLADTLVNGLGGDREGEVLTSDQLSRAMDMLVSLDLLSHVQGFRPSNFSQPNLQLRFYQLWAVLFQPPMAVDDQVAVKGPDAVLGRTLRAISLFIPQPVVFNRDRTTTQDWRIAFEKSVRPPQSSGDMTLTRLAKSITQDPNAYLLMLTGEENTTASATAVGAYFPGPLWKSRADGTLRRHDLRACTSHLLFQLMPEFRVLRWAHPLIPLMDIINTEGDTPSFEAIAESPEAFHNFSTPYRIGGQGRKSTGLCIDPESKSATLTHNATNADSSEIVWYEDMCTKCSNDDKALNETWEIKFNIKQSDIFSVAGAIDQDLVTRRVIRMEDQIRYTLDAAMPKVTGEELKMRIQGFGPTYNNNED